MERQQRATAIGVDQVVNIWETMNDGNPYFAVFFNRNNKYFQYNRDDIEKAKEFLSNNLQAVADAGDNALYYLNIYSEPKANYTNSGMVCSFPFRLNEFDESKSMAGVATTNMDAFSKLLKESNEKQLVLMQQIAELKSENQPLDWFDRIGAMMENPGAVQTIVPLLQPIIATVMGAIGKLTGTPVPGSMPVINNVPGIAGPGSETDKDEQLDLALDRLEKHGDLVDMLTTLADFADRNPGQFKSYFNMLKAS